MTSNKEKEKIYINGGSSESFDVPTCIGEECNMLPNKGQVDDGKPPDCTGKEKKYMKLKVKDKIGLATWNVRSMSSGKLETIAKEMLENNIDILGILEHRWKDQGYFATSNGGRIYYSGKPKSGLSGVAIFLNDKTQKSVLGYNPVNDRILTVRLRGTIKNVTIIQAYSPTNTAPNEEKEEFYETLQTQMDKNKRDIIIVMGDFNAKVGERQNEEEKGIVGKFAIGERNENGEMLVNFAIENEMTITNTMFQKHPRRLFTWTSPDGKSKNQIDYILIQRRWKSAISNAQTIPKADCDSDHELLKAIYKIKLKINKDDKGPIRYDMSHVSDEYKIEVRNKFQGLMSLSEEKSPEEMANEAKTIFAQATSHLKRRKHKKQKWITEETLKKIEERKVAKNNANGIHNEDYKKIAREVKRMIKTDKKNFIERKCEVIDSHFRVNKSRDAYNEIKNLTKNFQPKTGVIKDENGTVLTESNQILQRWQQYCENMFQESGVQTSQWHEDNTDLDLGGEPLRTEVEWAIKNMKDGKSPGCDEITAEMIKASGDPGIDFYLRICVKIWKTGEWPSDWKRSTFIMLPKKGDLKICSNHRTIALISHASKILLKIIMKRLESKIETEVSKTQAGFRKERGTRDHIFNLRNIIEKYREINRSLHICFIDYSKAFDCVTHEKLWCTLKEMGVQPNVVRLIRNLYIGQEAAVRLDCGTSESFPICKGVRQGCILSPHLFSLYTEGIMREVENDERNKQYNEPIIQGLKLRDLRYADDTALLSTTTDGLEHLIHSVKDHSEEKGLYLNAKKTKIIDIDKCVTTSDIKVNGEKIECIESFEYLGSRIEGNGKCSKEIRRRTTIASAQLKKLDKLWKGQSKETKIKIIRTCIFPTAIYGCESWTVTKTDEQKLNAFELQCYRKMLRISWTEKRKNEDILKELKISKNWLLNKIKKQKLNYFGHLKRHDSLEKHILEAKIEGKRGRGRPTRRWSDDIQDWLGMSPTEAGREAMDRQRFRRKVWEATSTHDKPDE